MIFRISQSRAAIVIDAIEETMADGTEISAGFMVRDDLSQLSALRRAIDAYIANHKEIPTDR